MEQVVDGRSRLAEVAQICTCGNVRRAARAVTQVFDAAFSELDLRSTQLTLLAHIGLHRRITISDLSREMVIDRTTLTRNLKLLERRELVTSEPGEDRRQKVWRLRRGGWELLQRAEERWARVQDQFIGSFGELRWKALMNDLGALVEIAGGVE